MTADADTGSDSQRQHEVEETVEQLVDQLDDRLAGVERETDGATERAVAEGRELLDELRETLRSGGSREGFEEYDTVDVSEAKKRP